MSNDLLIFVLIALIFLIALAYGVFKSWGVTYQDKNARLAAQNVQIFNSRLGELELDHQQGKLDTEYFNSLKVELERQLLAATGDLDQSEQTLPTSVGYKWYFWLFPLAGLAFYFAATQILSADDHAELWKFWQAQDQFGHEAEQMLTAKADKPSAEAISNPTPFIQALQSNAYHHAHDAERWLLLSGIYAAAEVPSFAMSAMEHAYHLAPDDDRMIMAYAKLRFEVQHGKMDDLTKQMVLQVLQKHPDDEAVMTLLAMGEYGNHHYKEATQLLEKMKSNRQAVGTQAGDNGSAIAQLDSAIAMVQAAQVKEANRIQNPTIHVQVTVADSLLKQVSPQSTVFIFARAMTGSPQPYAVQKIAGDALLKANALHQPLTLSLTNQNSMLPTRNLSTAQDDQAKLVVMARVSKTSNPIGESGDLESLPVPVETLADSKPTKLVVDQILP